jgi:hypothetical protein
LNSVIENFLNPKNKRTIDELRNFFSSIFNNQGEYKFKVLEKNKDVYKIYENFILKGDCNFKLLEAVNLHPEENKNVEEKNLKWMQKIIFENILEFTYLAQDDKDKLDANIKFIFDLIETMKDLNFLSKYLKQERIEESYKEALEELKSCPPQSKNVLLDKIIEDLNKKLHLKKIKTKKRIRKF